MTGPCATILPFFMIGLHTRYDTYEENIASDECKYSVTVLSQQNIDDDIYLHITSHSIFKQLDIYQCDEQMYEEVNEHPFAIKLRLNRGTQLHCEIHMTDPESGIRHHHVAIGTMKGANQLSGYKSIGQRNVYQPRNVHIRHGMRVMASVVTVNNAGSRVAASSQSVIVDWTPPVIELPVISIQRLDNNQLLKLLVSWNGTHDPETNITSCYWSIGELYRVNFIGYASMHGLVGRM